MDGDAVVAAGRGAVGDEPRTGSGGGAAVPPDRRHRGRRVCVAAGRGRPVAHERFAEHGIDPGMEARLIARWRADQAAQAHG